MLWQHLFWFFGHPEVYIIALPFFGIITEIIPVFSRKPLFGYKGMVFATLAIGFLSLAVWAHHMYATGAVLLPFFAFLTYLIAVPTGIKFFNWIGTMWRGQLTFETPMLWSIGFMVTFLLGGLTGVLLASPAAGLARHRLVLRRRPLPLRRVRHGRVRRLRRDLLLVPEDVRPDDGRAAGQAAVLDDLHRLPRDVPDPALAGQRGHAAPLRRLPGRRRVHHAEHDLDDLLVHPGRLDHPVPLQRRDSRGSTGSWRCATTPGVTATRWSGRPRRRRRGTTSSRSRGSAPSVRRSRRTTRTCGSGSRTRRTPASGTSPTPTELVGGQGPRQGPNDPDPT